MNKETYKILRPDIQTDEVILWVGDSLISRVIRWLVKDMG